MKIKILDRNYGCFKATLCCFSCEEPIVAKEFSYERDKISQTDTKKIWDVLNDLRKKNHKFYCCNCGEKIEE